MGRTGCTVYVTGGGVTAPLILNLWARCRFTLGKGHGTRFAGLGPKAGLEGHGEDKSLLLNDVCTQAVQPAWGRYTDDAIPAPSL